jgi:phage tail sheath protein FI
MAFQISPGVATSEVDLTTVVPSVQTTAGAFVGSFTWGPAEKIIQITNETQLLSRFGKPVTTAGTTTSANVITSFHTAASFLAYGNNLKIVRQISSLANNATANSSSPGVQIKNEDIFEYSYLNTTNNNNAYGAFVARYPGILGNSLTVSACDAGGAFSTWNVNGVGVSTYFPGAPGTSAQAAAAGASNDEIHIVVVDSGGEFTGTKNTVLEVYPYLSKARDSVDSLGNSNHYIDYLFKNSKYVYAIDPPLRNTPGSAGTTPANTWIYPLANTTNTAYATMNTTPTLTLVGGTTVLSTDAEKITAWNYFTNPDSVDISLAITGNCNIPIQQHVIDNVAGSRKDCIAFISPPSANVINQTGNEATNIQNWITALSRSSSYVVADSGWKYMFDKYSNNYQWIPLNGDIAGLCVYTDAVRDPWYSPAGYNRGNLKNVVKLAWNPNKTQRDSLYSIGVNPVGTFPGQGTVLFGDKTLQSKPSAFDRINVRRLFIVLEKSIAQAAKFSLFEFNDASTQNQFVNLITPFLADIKARRGIYDFRVVCDSTNNTPAVIDANQFVGDIYVKPSRSVNFIQLNFVAVRTGVDFTTIVGQA